MDNEEEKKQLNSNKEKHMSFSHTEDKELSRDKPQSKPQGKPRRSNHPSGGRRQRNDQGGSQDYSSRRPMANDHAAHQEYQAKNMHHPEEAPIERPAGPLSITKIADLQRMGAEELARYAHAMSIVNIGSLSKSQIVFEIVKAKSASPHEVLVGEGTLEVLPDGFGFLRSGNYNYLPSAEDIYVSPAQIRRFGLQRGDAV